MFEFWWVPVSCGFAWLLVYFCIMRCHKRCCIGGKKYEKSNRLQKY